MKGLPCFFNSNLLPNSLGYDLCDVVLDGLTIYSERLRPVKREITNNTRKMKNSTLAIEAAAATILKNPKIPAIIATIRKITDHFNMIITFPS